MGRTNARYPSHFLCVFLTLSAYQLHLSRVFSAPLLVFRSGSVWFEEFRHDDFALDCHTRGARSIQSPQPKTGSRLIIGVNRLGLSAVKLLLLTLARSLLKRSSYTVRGCAGLLCWLLLELEQFQYSNLVRFQALASDESTGLQLCMPCWSLFNSWRVQLHR